MATLVTPSPGAIAAAFYAVRTARLDSARPILELFRGAILDLDDAEADVLPQTLGRLLGLLNGDPRRRSALLDVLATFDLFEALPDVRRLTDEDAAPEILMIAAKLASNPGVTAEDRAAVVGMINNRPIDRRVKDTLRVLIDPAARAEGGLQIAAHAERWPGTEDAPIDRIAPSVAIDEVGAPPQQKWIVAAGLHEAGASLRRIPIAWMSEPLPGWLSPRMVVLTWEPARFARVIHAYPALSATQLRVLPRAAFAHTQAIRMVADYYGKERIVVPFVSTSLEAVNPINPDVYHLGSFDSHEVAVLTGTKRSDLYSTLHDVLPPARKVDHGVYWSFNQVVALRTWQFFRAQSTRRRPSRELLSSLVGFAGGSSPTSVGVTADGQVLRRDGDAWVGVASDQIYLEPVRSLDSVFQPFEMGGDNGSSKSNHGVPALLGPSHHSKVHPVLLGGSPAVIGTRIPVRALAEYERDQGPGTASRAYGVDPAIVSDVLPLGFRLIGA